MLFALKIIAYLVYVVLHRARTFAEVSFKVMHFVRATNVRIIIAAREDSAGKLSCVTLYAVVAARLSSGAAGSKRT